MLVEVVYHCSYLSGLLETCFFVLFHFSSFDPLASAAVSVFFCIIFCCYRKDDDENTGELFDEIDEANMEYNETPKSQHIPSRSHEEEILNVEGDISDEGDGDDYRIPSDKSSFDSSEEDSDIEKREFQKNVAEYL